MGYNLVNLINKHLDSYDFEILEVTKVTEFQMYNQNQFALFLKTNINKVEIIKNFLSALILELYGGSQWLLQAIH